MLVKLSFSSYPINLILTVWRRIHLWFIIISFVHPLCCLTSTLFYTPAYKVWGRSILFSGCPWFRHSVIPISFPHNISRTNGGNFDQILHVHWYWQDLGWDIRRQFSSVCNRRLALDDPWFLSELRFRSISIERWNLTKLWIKLCIDIDKN